VRLTFVAADFRQGSSVVEQPRTPKSFREQEHSGLVVQEKFANLAHEIYARVAQW
jgi:hypothetical protein